jgi:hypothetical protein
MMGRRKVLCRISSVLIFPLAGCFQPDSSKPGATPSAGPPPTSTESVKTDEMRYECSIERVGQQSVPRLFPEPPADWELTSDPHTTNPSTNEVESSYLAVYQSSEGNHYKLDIIEWNGDTAAMNCCRRGRTDDVGFVVDTYSFYVDGNARGPEEVRDEKIALLDRVCTHISNL